MSWHGGNLYRSLVTFALLLTSFWLGALRPAAAQGRGKGGGGGTPTGWEEHFDITKGIDLTRWVKGTAQTPAPGNTQDNIGSYDPNHVELVQVEGNTYLRIKLTQETSSSNPLVTISKGGLLSTTQTYPYGTYEWRMRMSSPDTTPEDPGGSPVSGNVSAGFIYVNNSQTEIDFEFSGDPAGLDSRLVYMVSWRNKRPKSPAPVTDSQVSFVSLTNPDLTAYFRTYRFIWQEGKIEYCVDGIHQTDHLTNVPTAPAYFMINHWGTNSSLWGGLATIGTARYFYVDRVGYTPLLLACSDSFRLP